MKKLITEYFTVGFFLALLVIPMVCYPFVRDHFLKDSGENRILAERPILRFDQISNFPKEFEEYFNDHLPFRMPILNFNMIMRFTLFGQIDSDRVLLGKDDWLFYKRIDDGDPLGSFQGINPYTPEELETIINNVTAVDELLRRQGCRLVLFLAPNKSVVYSNYMPNRIHVVNPYRRADQAVEYIRKNSSIPVIYPKDELILESKKTQTYYQYDTHWNAVGAFIGSQQLGETLQGDRCYLNDIAISWGSRTRTGDLAQMLGGLSEQFGKDYIPEIHGYRQGYDGQSMPTREQWKEEYRQYQCPQAKDQRHVFILGDSFAEGMEPYLSKMFAKTTFSLFFNGFNQALLDLEKPDIIVYELVERSTDRLLTDLPIRFGVDPSV